MQVQDLMRRLMSMPMDAEVRVHDKHTKSAPLVIDVTEVSQDRVFIHIDKKED